MAITLSNESSHMHIGFPYEARFIIITCLDYAWDYINFPIPKNHPSKTTKISIKDMKFGQIIRNLNKSLKLKVLFTEPSSSRPGRDGDWILIPKAAMT